MKFLMAVDHAMVTSKTADGYTAVTFDPAKHKPSASDAVEINSGEWVIEAENAEEAPKKLVAVLEELAQYCFGFPSPADEDDSTRFEETVAATTAQAEYAEALANGTKEEFVDYLDDLEPR